MKYIPSLYWVCLKKTTELLKNNNHWSLKNNQFVTFPPRIVEDLVAFLTSETETSLNAPAIHFLVATGRIENLVLDHRALHPEIMRDIFRKLLPSARRLKSIKVNVRRIQHWMYSDFGKLIHSASNLVALETTINFNLRNVFRAGNILIKLTLNCQINEDTLPYNTRSSFCSLRVLNVQEHPLDPQFHRNLKRLIDRCPALVATSCNLAPIVILDDESSPQREIKKGCLGHRHIPVDAAGVDTVSSRCPFLSEVIVTPRGNDAIRNLSEFRHLKLLKLNAPSEGSNDYRLGLLPLLKTPGLGPKLKHLDIKGFSKVDFYSISAFCPHLEKLSVNYATEGDDPDDFGTASFTYLTSLSVLNTNPFVPCNRSRLINLLSNATDLECLVIGNGRYFDDVALDTIMARNPLSRLNMLFIHNWGISLEGLQKIASNLTSLQAFYVGSHLMDKTQALRILCEMPNLAFWYSCPEYQEHERVMRLLAGGLQLHDV